MGSLPMTMNPEVALTARSVRDLYVEHGAELRQALSRLAPDCDADDLLQELFVVALGKVDALGQAQSPRAWLFGVAVKLATSRRRTVRLRRFLGLDAAVGLGGADSPGRTVEQRDAQRLMERALRPLSDAKREVFVLYELQALPGEDIAQALGIPLKTVWTRLFHARRDVAAELERLTAIEARTSGLSRDEVAP
jgi:RNA polymerase sigma-70 factor (ECF subfamily)